MFVYTTTPEFKSNNILILFGTNYTLGGRKAQKYSRRLDINRGQGPSSIVRSVPVPSCMEERVGCCRLPHVTRVLHK